MTFYFIFSGIGRGCDFLPKYTQIYHKIVIFIVGPNGLGAGTIWARATWGQTGLGPDRPDTASNSFHRSHTLELAAAV
jgi:hypothetical protein